MPSQKIVRKFTRRARADIRRQVGLGLWDETPAYQAGAMVGTIICNMAQAKREHPHISQEQLSRLGTELMHALTPLVPTYRPSSGGETSKEEGNA